MFDSGKEKITMACQEINEQIYEEIQRNGFITDFDIQSIISRVFGALVEESFKLEE